MRKTGFILLWIASVMLAGCTSLGQIRTDYSAAKLNAADQTNEILLSHCTPGKKGTFSGRDLKNVIEDYGTHLIGFVEYSDQGWEYNAGSQRKALLERLNADLADPAYANTVFLNITFVHGWHHNAEDGDCNVNEFRAMVHRVSDDINKAAERAGLGIRFRVNGIYAGWRGESTTVPLVRQASILTRRTSAEHVAKGSVRELFADLRELEYRDAVRDGSAKGRVRTIVVGHSFGALIAFHSLSQSLINDLALNRKRPVTGSGGCSSMQNAPPLWPDFTVLINPAFEASRFEPVHSAAAARSGCPHPPQRPKLIVVTSDNDAATGTFFPLFRSLAALFEKYDATSAESHENERLANLHAIGFVDRYKTHRLDLDRDRPTACIRQSRDPDGSAFDPNSPVWVVGVTPDIVFGHDGFLFPDVVHGKYEPYLLNWLINVYLDAVSPQSELRRLYEQYASYRCVDKARANVVIQEAVRQKSRP